VNDLELTKNASANPTLAGANLIYTLVAVNHGPNDGTSVTITDTLPSGVSFLSASSGCSENLGTVTCHLGSLASSDSLTKTITVNVITTTLGTVSNSATISSDYEDPDTDNNLASVSVQSLPYLVVYNNDFETGLGDFWCSDVFTSATPTASRHFLGEFDTQEDVCLAIPTLNEHTLVSLSFDLFVIRSWDGNFNDGVVGADRWQLTETSIGSINTLLDTSFNNWTNHTQSYPGSYPGDQYPSRTGANEINTLGYLWGGNTPMDSVYKMEFTFDHDDNSLDLDFLADGLQNISDESWGLDNIRVIISAGAELHPLNVFMPIIIR